MKATGIYDFHVHIGETIGGHLLADSWKSFNRLYEHNGLEGIGVFVTSPNESLRVNYPECAKLHAVFQERFLASNSQKPGYS